MPDSEAALIQRAQQGDPNAFAELVQEHQTYVYNLALRALGSPAEAQDLTQECFIRVWQALPRFRYEARFRTWLYRIVINLCINQNPRLKREMENLPIDASEEMVLPQYEDDPASSLEKAQRRAFLYQKINELPPSYRLMIQLRYHQGMAYDEIAEILSLPLGTVKTGLYRAHAQLRDALAVYEEVYVC